MHIVKPRKVERAFTNRRSADAVISELVGKGGKGGPAKKRLQIKAAADFQELD